MRRRCTTISASNQTRRVPSFCSSTSERAAVQGTTCGHCATRSSARAAATRRASYRAASAITPLCAATARPMRTRSCSRGSLSANRPSMSPSRSRTVDGRRSRRRWHGRMPRRSTGLRPSSTLSRARLTMLCINSAPRARMSSLRDSAALAAAIRAATRRSIEYRRLFGSWTPIRRIRSLARIRCWRPPDISQRRRSAYRVSMDRLSSNSGLHRRLNSSTGTRRDRHYRIGRSSARPPPSTSVTMSRSIDLLAARRLRLGVEEERPSGRARKRRRAAVLQRITQRVNRRSRGVRRRRASTGRRSRTV